MPARTLEQTIGENVRALRKRVGGNQAALGEALAPFLGGKGWTRQTVWKAEQGGRSFTAAELLALAATLEVTVPQLFETLDPVRMPNGRELAPQIVEGLLAGVTTESEKQQRLTLELRGLRRFHQKLTELVDVNGAQLIRFEHAITGASDYEPETGGKGILAAVNVLAQRANQIAKQWTEPDRKFDNVTWKD